MIKVYASGVMYIDHANPWSNRSSRLWTLYAKFEDAERSIMENGGDLFENYYNYALIEEHFLIDPSASPSGFYGIPQWWYHADYSHGDKYHPHITKIEAPEWAKNVCNFWVG